MDRRKFITAGALSAGLFLSKIARSQDVPMIVMDDDDNDEPGFYIALLSAAVLGETFYGGKDYQVNLNVRYPWCLCSDDRIVGGKNSGRLDIYNPKKRNKYALSGNLANGQGNLTLIDNKDSFPVSGNFDAAKGVRVEFEWPGNWAWSKNKLITLEGKVRDGKIDLARQPRGHPHLVGTYSSGNIEAIIKKDGRNYKIDGTIKP